MTLVNNGRHIASSRRYIAHSQRQLVMPANMKFVQYDNNIMGICDVSLPNTAIVARAYNRRNEQQTARGDSGGQSPMMSWASWLPKPLILLEADRAERRRLITLRSDGAIGMDAGHYCHQPGLTDLPELDFCIFVARDDIYCDLIEKSR